MAINITNSTGGRDFKFLTNQSSILLNSDTNDVTINGVNVIVDKPKRGDVMCVKDGQVVWIDGLSINPEQLSSEIEPVGICLKIKGNKALVRYREEKSFRWSAGERLELPNSSIMNDGAEHTLQITLNGKVNSNPFVYTASTRAEFVEKLNTWFLANDTTYSVELVELDTDKPAVDTSDVKDEDSYRNRIIVNASFNGEDDWNYIDIEEIGEGIGATGKHIKAVDYYYKNNGFSTYDSGGCCQAKYYDWFSIHGYDPKRVITSIDNFSPVELSAFNYNTNCQILRDNFATYDEYIDSLMVKFPCGKGGVITEFPSGKENTYKLADCTFLDNATGKQEILYPAANWAASIDINAPKLGKGNWWLPSAAEMVEIMHDITYDTSFWETKSDIVNSVLAKLTSISNSSWSMLSASTYRWTSSKCSQNNAYCCYGYNGDLDRISLYFVSAVAPITLYEF